MNLEVTPLIWGSKTQNYVRIAMGDQDGKSVSLDMRTAPNIVFKDIYYQLPSLEKIGNMTLFWYFCNISVR